MARRAPDATALTDSQGRMSYASLDRLANRLAHRLVAAGVGPGRLVGVVAHRTSTLVVATLAVLKAGGAYVPLDPAYPAERLAFTLADADPVALLAEPELTASLDDGRRPVIALDEAAFGPGPEHDPETPVEGRHPAYVIYTSGSTGTPKGVVVSHHNVSRLFTSTEPWFRFGPQDTWTLFHSHAFDFSVWELFGALVHGGRLVVVPGPVSRDPAAFLDLLVHEGVTVLNQTPSAFRGLMRAALTRPETPALRLREVVFGGEALDVGSLRPWIDRFGDAGPRLVNMYGITETTVHVTYRPITRADLEAGHRSPIGEPIPDLTLHLLDPEGRPVPDGVAGELYVGGAGVAGGYLGRPELTAARFLPDPASPDGTGRLYRSGDGAVRRADGTLDYLGRLDGQVKLRGFRIEPGEIEATLLAHPSVADAAVVLRGEGDAAALVAYVVASPDLDAAGLRTALRARLPDHMVPAHIVPIERLPLTVNGKLDRAALPDPAPPAATVAAPPGSEMERLLASIWQRVLGLAAVDLDANFFDLGGNSILLVAVHADIRRALRRELPMVALFRHPTLRALAAHLGGTDAAPGLADTRSQAARAARSREAMLRLRGSRPFAPARAPGGTDPAVPA